MTKKFNPAIRIVMTILIYFTAMFTVLGICLWVGIVEKLRTDYSLLAIMNIVAGVVIGGTVLLVYRWLDKRNPFKLGFQIRRKDVGFASVIIVVFTLIVWGFAWTVGQDNVINAEFHYDKLLNLSYLSLLVLGFVGWFIGVLQEEILNRGYFFANLKQMSVIAMFIISNLIFSLTHVPTSGFHPDELLIHFIGGLSYGYVYFKSGSLWLSTLVHGTHNLLLDVLFNNDYSVTLVTFAQQLTNNEKLLLQIILFFITIVITALFYGKGRLLKPAKNLSEHWNDKELMA